MRKKCLILFIIALFLSCAGAKQDAPNIQDIVNKWSAIEADFTKNDNINFDSIDSFYESLIQFKQSELFRIYNSIPYSPEVSGSFGLHIPDDIKEIEQNVGNILDNTHVFRDSIIAHDIDTAHTAASEITSGLIRLLKIEGEIQRFVASSYFNLLMTLAGFIIIIVLLTGFLYQALIRSLKREDEGIKLTHTYMLAQEEERFRISRELHDTVIQDMRCVLLETEKIGVKIPMIADLIRKTRTLCNDLVPPDFRFRELPDALRQLCLEISEKTGINCRPEIDENIKLDSLALEKKLQVFRIVREALANVEKHAQAKEAIVTMRAERNGAIFIGISDDGKGFISPLDNKGQIVSGIDKSHIGIISMKERAAILGGILKIITSPGEGTLVCVEVPVS